MKTTLISFIGTGLQSKNGDGYENTNYVFPVRKNITTNIFLKALLETRYRNFSKIVLVGTVTSGWDMLVEDDEDLWLKVREAKEKNLISGEIISEVEKHVSQKTGIPVIIKYHTDVIDDDTSQNIFDLYSSIVPEINDENILFDITHSFRSMPILLYQALQFSVSQNPKIKNVEIVYGEFKTEEKLSYVRDLSSYWKYSQISDALYVFNQKLDGFRLADLILDEWEAGSKAIRRFSEVVQTNFCLQIADVAAQLRNSLKQYPENAPEWLGKVRDDVSKILKAIDVENKNLSGSLLSFSKFLYERKLNVQAVICLQVAVETRICESENSEDKIGDYEWWQKHGREVLHRIKGEDWKKIGNPLTNLEVFRNQIAHGGGKNKDGNFPHAANIPNIYESGKRGVENLFRDLSI